MSSNIVKVRIGPVVLGEVARMMEIGARGSPNPTTITWWQDYTITEKPIVRHKPQTQCTQPEALWKCRMRFLTLTTEKKDELLALNAGPHLVLTGLHEICMWIKHKEVTQVEADDDKKYEWSFEFVEAYPK